MGQLVGLLEQAEEELINRRIRAETRLVKTYRLSEAERLAVIEKYGPPMEPEKAEKIRQRYRAAHFIKTENQKGRVKTYPPAVEDTPG